MPSHNSDTGRLKTPDNIIHSPSLSHVQASSIAVIVFETTYNQIQPLKINYSIAVVTFTNGNHVHVKGFFSSMFAHYVTQSLYAEV